MLATQQASRQVVGNGASIMLMSRRSTIYAAGLTLLAAGAAVSAGWLIFEANQLQRAYEQQAQAQAQGYRYRAHINTERRCIPMAPEAERECIREEAETARKGQHDEYDLQAQLVTSVWTRYMGIAAIIGMAVGIFGIGLIFVTFRATRRAAVASDRMAEEAAKATLAATEAAKAGQDANKIARTGIREARKSDQTAQRAWVKFEIEARHGPRKHHDDDMRFAFKGHLTNIGQTPAIEATYWPLLCFENPEEKFAAELKKIRKKPLDWTGSPILPGDEYPINFTANVDEKTRLAAGLGHSGYENGSMVYLIMIVQYRTIHDDTPHYTAGLFSLVKKSSLVSAINFDSFCGEGDLMLRRYQEGPGYVD
jgi:hypothetical protein